MTRRLLLTATISGALALLWWSARRSGETSDRWATWTGDSERGRWRVDGASPKPETTWTLFGPASDGPVPGYRDEAKL